MLHLTIDRENGTDSISRFRVFRTGRITESGDRGIDGSGVREDVTIDKITDDGVTLTITLISDIPDTPTMESKKQIFVPYDKEITVTDWKDSTITARLERNKRQ